LDEDDQNKDGNEEEEGKTLQDRYAERSRSPLMLSVDLQESGPSLSRSLPLLHTGLSGDESSGLSGQNTPRVRRLSLAPPLLSAQSTDRPPSPGLAAYNEELHQDAQDDLAHAISLIP
jgi:hypothetical protein